MTTSRVKTSGLAEIDTKLLHQFVSGSGAILNPMAAICCGTVGQKVVTACSGKLHPSYQFFYLGFIELLPVGSLNLDEVEPQHRRYDDLICAFQYKLQKKLEDARVFIVQYGTLGDVDYRQPSDYRSSPSINGIFQILDMQLLHSLIFANWSKDIN
ncbi:hypothetical protein J5N97_021415 [Dioscorea zingiberensis]|uniref:Uncharacterized protein n=1 Tax=Dioscorea zingiberensis TaxID=325984 RepID=A0A9D5HE80_9LILI|nr:hypothetical protein J5N97_021415 [Dioscorea zingiberensis]